mgnify:CR=1 FL=1
MIREYLKEHILITDGAMGTYYDRKKSENGRIASVFQGFVSEKRSAHFPCRPFPVFLQFSWDPDFGIITASHPSFRPPGQTSRPVSCGSRT